MEDMSQQVEPWVAGLQARQLADLTFPEVSRALRALSSAYVERRAKLKEGAALSGAGKRAAFALYYGPLHFLLIEHIVGSLGEPFVSVRRVLDLGCGIGASGAGWAAACRRPPKIVGLDRNAWAVEEARRTYAVFGLDATVRTGTLQDRAASAGSRGSGNGQGGDRRAIAESGVLLAFVVNEIADRAVRDSLLEDLLRRVEQGGHVLVVEPLARQVAPWWNSWARELIARGGRADEWRFRPEVPAIVERLGQAAGLDYREVKGRSLAV